MIFSLSLSLSFLFFFLFSSQKRSKLIGTIMCTDPTATTLEQLRYRIRHSPHLGDRVTEPYFFVTHTAVTVPPGLEAYSRVQQLLPVVIVFEEDLTEGEEEGEEGEARGIHSKSRQTTSQPQSSRLHSRSRYFRQDQVSSPPSQTHGNTNITTPGGAESQTLDSTTVVTTVATSGALGLGGEGEMRRGEDQPSTTNEGKEEETGSLTVVPHRAQSPPRPYSRLSLNSAATSNQVRPSSRRDAHSAPRVVSQRLALDDAVKQQERKQKERWSAESSRQLQLQEQQQQHLEGGEQGKEYEQDQHYYDYDDHYHQEYYQQYEPQEEEGEEQS